MNKVLFIGLAAVLLIGGFLVFGKDRTVEMENTPIERDFSNPKKSAHYESNTPAHGSVLAGVPINIVIDFNFDLAKPSEIKILKDGTDYGVGETIIDDNKIAMRRVMKADASDGVYKVEYKACWPDGSCHDGHFEFVIKRSEGTSYEDLTDESLITIRMSEIRFKPMNIKIRAGTKVVWINDDEVEHYVNTETHPAHTYFRDQNSRVIKKGEDFETVFNKPGIYPYHCSAHASVMTGNILVENP